MTQKEPFPNAIVTAMMFVSLLGTVGCMTWHSAVTSAASHVASTIDSAESATAKCQDFSCEP